MKVSMPVGNDAGWEIAGTYLKREIGYLPSLDGVTLHCIPLHDFEPRDRGDWNTINIGYCFFEHDILAYHSIPKASKQWDFIVAGSRWCEYHLRMAGVRKTTTILQGIDQTLFSPAAIRNDDGRFIVFSGGKFEFRKGQDIVIAAMKIFMERHHDAWLACSWHNHWENSIKTMEQSSLITLNYHDLPCDKLYQELLIENGIDMSRVIIHPKADNSLMPRIYAESDLGLFPNRCEGGNNMVMCEYMACGRPVIASTWSGHSDVITPENAFGLTPTRPVICRLNGLETAVWLEPAVDDVLLALELAYQKRDLTHAKAKAAGESMQSLTWNDSARKFHAIAQHLVSDRIKLKGCSRENSIDTAELLFKEGHYLDAEKAYRNLLEKAPLDPDIYNCLGTVLDRLERFQEATLYYSKAISLRPSYASAHYNLANTMKRMGNVAESVEQLQKVVALDAKFVDAWQNLGVCFFEQKDFTRAVECFEKAVSLDPDRSGCHASLGEIYFQAGSNIERGLECLEIALLCQPGNVELLNLQGLMLHELEQYEKAEIAYREGLLIEPDNPILLNNMGNMYQARGLPEKAVLYFNLSLSQDPGNDSVIFNRAMSRLTMEDYARGWEDYEARFNKQTPVVVFHEQLPRWEGQTLGGKKLLVWSEQVYGDAIQFARYLPLLARFNGQIIFEALDNSLAPLFKSISGVDQMIVRGETVPEADWQVPLACLPRIFKTTSENIPFPEGYLRPDVAKMQKWAVSISQLTGDRQRKIGIVWGGRKPRLNANRSMTLRCLEPLLEIDGIRWFSLQLGDDRRQLDDYHKHDIIDLADKIDDFGDTAAVLASLDLLLTIDTSVAHLAGALGVPVWVMLKSSPDWRWLLGRSDSPWYSSARLFRQKHPGAWGDVIEEVREELTRFLNI